MSYLETKHFPHDCFASCWFWELYGLILFVETPTPCRKSAHVKDPPTKNDRTLELGKHRWENMLFQPPSCPQRASPHWLGSIHTQEEADVEDQRCGASLRSESVRGCDELWRCHNAEPGTSTRFRGDFWFQYPAGLPSICCLASGKTWTQDGPKKRQLTMLHQNGSETWTSATNHWEQ